MTCPFLQNGDMSPGEAPFSPTSFDIPRKGRTFGWVSWSQTQVSRLRRCIICLIRRTFPRTWSWKYTFDSLSQAGPGVTTTRRILMATWNHYECWPHVNPSIFTHRISCTCGRVFPLTNVDIAQPPVRHFDAPGYLLSQILEVVRIPHRVQR
jgi:hypothetical protein